MHARYIKHFSVLIINAKLYKSSLREKVLEAFPMAHEQIKERNTIIVYHKEMSEMLVNALAGRNSLEDSCILANAAALLRKDMS